MNGRSVKRCGETELGDAQDASQDLPDEYLEKKPSKDLGVRTEELEDDYNISPMLENQQDEEGEVSPGILVAAGFVASVTSQKKVEEASPRELSEQTIGESHQKSSNSFILRSFLRNILEKVVEELSKIQSEASFERIRVFCSNAKQLVKAVRESYSSVKPDNRTLGFLRRVHEASQGKAVAFSPEEEEMRVFFSHYTPDLLGKLCDVFQDWGETAGLRVVLLHGKPGTGKTESLKWLFEKRTDEDMAVVNVGPGSILTEDEYSPNLFDMLLLKPAYWRCLNMSAMGGELSGGVCNPLLECLVSKEWLDRGTNTVFFHSQYFGVDIPVKTSLLFVLLITQSQLMTAI